MAFENRLPRMTCACTCKGVTLNPRSTNLYVYCDASRGTDGRPIFHLQILTGAVIFSILMLYQNRTNTRGGKNKRGSDRMAGRSMMVVHIVAVALAVTHASVLTYSTSVPQCVSFDPIGLIPVLLLTVWTWASPRASRPAGRPEGHAM
jgi:hypothetical protein